MLDSRYPGQIWRAQTRSGFRRQRYWLLHISPTHIEHKDLRTRWVHGVLSSSAPDHCKIPCRQMTYHALANIAPTFFGRHPCLHEGSVTMSRLSRKLNWTRSFLPVPSAQGTKPLRRPVDGWKRSLAAVMLPPVIDTALAHFDLVMSSELLP